MESPVIISAIKTDVNAVGLLIKYQDSLLHSLPLSIILRQVSDMWISGG